MQTFSYDNFLGRIDESYFDWEFLRGRRGLCRHKAVVVDTTGVLLGNAMTLVADGGRVVAMGFNTKAAVSLRNQDLVGRALTLLGAGDYDDTIFPRAIDLAAELPLDRLVTHRLALRDIARTTELLGFDGTVAGSYGAMKVVVES